MEEVIINLIIGKGAFNIPVQFALKNRKETKLNGTKRKSSFASLTPITKIGKTKIALVGDIKRVVKVFLGEHSSFVDSVMFLGQQLAIPFNITIDKHQDLGKKNKIEGASRITFPAEIQGMKDNFVAKRYDLIK